MEHKWNIMPNVSFQRRDGIWRLCLIITKKTNWLIVKYDLYIYSYIFFFAVHQSIHFHTSAIYEVGCVLNKTEIIQNNKFNMLILCFQLTIFETVQAGSVNFRFCLLFTWDNLWTGALETLALRWGPIADSVWCACYCPVIDGVSPRWLANSAVMKWLPRLCWLGSLTCTWIYRGT